MVRPLGFELDDKKIKRAGLDYWQHVDLKVHEDWAAFEASQLEQFTATYLVSKEDKLGETNLLDTSFDFSWPEGRRRAEIGLIFGNEDKGLTGIAEHMLAHPRVYLPMSPHIRSYNLANSVSMVLWEAHRQLKKGR